MRRFRQCPPPGVLALACVLAGAGLHGVAIRGDAATVSIDVVRRDEAIVIEASALIAADTSTAWRVLTDYGRYVEFIPDLRVSKVVARHGSQVVVRQSGDAALWRLRVPIDVTYEITETAPARLRSRAVAGSLRMLESDYTLTPRPPGVRLDYVGRAATGFGLPGPLEEIVVERNVARQFRALVDAIERRAVGEREDAAAATPAPIERQSPPDGQVQRPGR